MPREQELQEQTIRGDIDWKDLCRMVADLEATLAIYTERCDALKSAIRRIKALHCFWMYDESFDEETLCLDADDLNDILEGLDANT